MNKILFVSTSFALLMSNISVQENRFTLKPNEALTYKKCTIVWDSFIGETTINPDGTSGEHFVTCYFAIQENVQSLKWEVTLPADYKSSMKTYPENVTFRGDRLSFKIIDANLEAHANAFVVIEIVGK